MKSFQMHTGTEHAEIYVLYGFQHIVICGMNGDS